MKNMKKVINGKIYNTETAKCILGLRNRGYDKNYLMYEWEHLYKKKTGEYFLYLEGGAEARIIPLSEAGAKKWAKEVLIGDDYEAIFGPVPE